MPYCRVFKRARQIIRAIEKREKINYTCIDEASVDHEGLDIVKEEIMQGIDWDEVEDGELDVYAIINACLLAPEMQEREEEEEDEPQSEGSDDNDAESLRSLAEEEEIDED